MDPQATLQEIDAFIKDGSTGEEVDYLCRALYNWIRLGGFEPNWNRYPVGTAYYKTRKAMMKHGKD
jgi:hypothetical protein